MVVVINPSALRCEAYLTRSTQPAMLPPMKVSCSRNARKVVREKPKHVGIFFDLKKLRTLIFLQVEFWVSLETRVEVEGEASVSLDGEAVGSAARVVLDALAFELSVSAGCLAGSAASGLKLLASSSVSAPSTYPISPRFDGSGPAWGRGFP